MPFPFRKERGLKHWRVLDCSGLRKVESVFQQHGNTQRNQQVDGFLCRGAHLGTTERRSPVLCYSFVFVFISGHALCLTLCFSPTFLLSVTGCSVWSAIAAEILKKLQCRNLLNGKPQCGQKSPTKITIIWTSWLAYILFKPYKNETNWIFWFFFPSAWLLALQPTLTVSPLCRLSFTLALPAEYTQLKCTKQLRVAQRSTKLWSTCCLMLTAVLETPHESLLSRQPLDGDMSPWHFLDPADFHCCFPVLSFFFFVLVPTVLSLIIWANNLKNSPAAC